MKLITTTLLAILGLVIPMAVDAANNGFAEGTLKPQTMVRVYVPVVARHPTKVHVRGTGGDLDCYLYHERDPGTPFGKFVTRDDSAKDGCDLVIKPNRTETYLLLVQNTSDHDERYVVSTEQ